MTDYFVQIFKGYKRFIQQTSDDHTLGMENDSHFSRRKPSVEPNESFSGDHHHFNFPAFVRSRRYDCLLTQLKLIVVVKYRIYCHLHHKHSCRLIVKLMKCNSVKNE